MIKDQLMQALQPGPDARYIRELILAYLDSFATKNIEGRLALFAPDASFEDPVGAKPLVGRDALRAFWTSSAGLDIAATLKRIAICANEACYEFEAQLQAGAADRARVLCFETLKVDSNGLIAQMRAYFDSSCIS